MHLKRLSLLSLCSTFGIALFLSCSSPSPESFREEGNAITKTLIKELQQIHSRDELVQRTETLEELYHRLVEAMIAARKFQESNPDARPFPLSASDRQLSDKLRNELARLYSIPGARKIIEASQRPSLNKLDVFEKQLKKKKNFGS